MLHGSLAIDFESGVVLGFPNIQLWDRGKLTTTKNERKYGQLSIEDKEYYKWIAAVNESEKVLQKAASITFVSDRESDIYKYRWYIEQLHQLLKTEGFKIESSELESGYSI
ncbi:MAG: hypothetical protein QM535_12940 [Limnohabitans sp.]|nr:hypothetical protein [Limnohabitans sp.]